MPPYFAHVVEVIHVFRVLHVTSYVTMTSKMYYMDDSLMCIDSYWIFIIYIPFAKVKYIRSSSWQNLCHLSVITSGDTFLTFLNIFCSHYLSYTWFTISTKLSSNNSLAMCRRKSSNWVYLDKLVFMDTKRTEQNSGSPDAHYKWYKRYKSG